MPTSPNRYAAIIEHIFLAGYTPGAESVVFERDEIEAAARAIGVRLPKNLGDVVYSFRYRNALPDAIRATEPAGRAWVIAKKGRSTYAFELRADVRILPDRCSRKPEFRMRRRASWPATRWTTSRPFWPGSATTGSWTCSPA